MLALPVAAAAFFTLTPSPGAMAQSDPEGPVLVYQNIQDGDVLDQIPLLIQLCFKEPINIRDKPDGGDFDFNVIQPDGKGLGHRDIFQPDGWGVAVQPGNPISDTAGEWTFTYRVTTPDGQHATTGVIKYTVDPDGGRPAPRVSPPACVPAGGTATASPEVTPPPTNAPIVTGEVPSLTQAPTTAAAPGTASPVPTRNPDAVDEGDGGTDVTEIALITAGIVGILAVLTLIGYLVRRAVGFDPHRPKPGGGDDHH